MTAIAKFVKIVAATLSAQMQTMQKPDFSVEQWHDTLSWEQIKYNMVNIVFFFTLHGYDMTRFLQWLLFINV